MTAHKARFGLGDTVYRARVIRQPINKPCEVCEGKGRARIVNSDKTTYCPECRGCGSTEIDSIKVRTEVESLTIGMVRTELIRHVERDEFEVCYMCEETGVGTGSVYYENKLGATPQEAEAIAVGAQS